MQQRRGGSVLRAVLAGSLALLPAGCAAPGGGATRGGETVESRAAADAAAIDEAHRALVRAFQAGDAEGVLALLDSGPDLVIFHPFLENRFDGVEEARDGLARMMRRVGRLEWNEVHRAVHLEGDTAWATSQVLARTPTRPNPFIGRATEIWVRRDAGWRLVHGHWSEHARLAGGGPER